MTDEDELRQREIARSHGWPEDDLVKEVKRLVESYGYMEDQALAEAQKHFARKSGLQKLKKISPVQARLGTEKPEAKAAGSEAGREGKTEETPPAPAPHAPAAAKAEIDPRLISWLNMRGFRQLAGKPCYTKHDKIQGAIVRMAVDFKSNPWGNRIAYALDEDTGEWKPENGFRDCEELLAFKHFRDELRKGEETKLVAKTAEVPKAAEASPGVLTVQKEQEIFLMVEQRDESQITKEILGEVLKEYVYSISKWDEESKRMVKKPIISYAGIKEAARRRGNIHVTRIELEETRDGKAHIGKAEVYDLSNNFKTWGVAVQRKKMRLRDGREVDDDFSLTKAVSKAIRNGLKACIPEKLIASLVSKWLEEHGG